jgi:5'-nucleotidase
MIHNEDNPNVVLIDMDNTIADLEKWAAAGYSLRYGKELPIERLDFEFPPEIDKELKVVLKQPRFYYDMPPIEGAVEAILEMHKEGWDIFFCTSPLSDYEHCVPEKYAWIEKHFGREWTKKIIVTKDKTLVRGRYLIDDHPSPRGNFKPHWTHIVFDQSYNRQGSTQNSKKRIREWKHWRSVLSNK